MAWSVVVWGRNMAWLVVVWGRNMAWLVVVWGRNMVWSGEIIASSPVPPFFACREAHGELSRVRKKKVLVSTVCACAGIS